VDKNGLRTLTCPCPCKREFTTRDSRKRYFEHGCAARFKKAQIEKGKVPPDYYVTCEICEAILPRWKIITPIPLKTNVCSNQCCLERVSGTGRNPQGKWNAPKYTIKQLKSLKKIRTEYCGGNWRIGKEECKHYSECLDPSAWNGPCFTKYLDTDGKCRE